eukprot:1155926-Pelagomonas_calceolata.AAC.7
MSPGQFGDGELTYSFHQDFPAGCLFNPGELFLCLNAVFLGQQLKQLPCKPPPPAAATAGPVTSSRRQQ